ncbi:MAG: CBS domain-containing protein [Thermodesulfobacteriota bacterium]
MKARSFPVVAPDGHLVGIIAREDIMRALKEATTPAG